MSNDRSRTVANILAALVIAALLGIGGWVANTMAQVQGAPDCTNYGGTRCEVVYTPYLSPHLRDAPYPVL